MTPSLPDYHAPLTEKIPFKVRACSYFTKITENICDTCRKRGMETLGPSQKYANAATATLWSFASFFHPFSSLTVYHISLCQDRPSIMQSSAEDKKYSFEWSIDQKVCFEGMESWKWRTMVNNGRQPVGKFRGGQRNKRSRNFHVSGGTMFVR